jgi:hypothetical protein
MFFLKIKTNSWTYLAISPLLYTHSYKVFFYYMNHAHINKINTQIYIDISLSCITLRPWVKGNMVDNANNFFVNLSIDSWFLLSNFFHSIRRESWPKRICWSLIVCLIFCTSILFCIMIFLSIRIPIHTENKFIWNLREN